VRLFVEDRLRLVLPLLGACGGTAPALDTSCPARGPTPAVLFAELSERGIVGPPETLGARIRGEEIVVGWKNLLSGRQLTLSCAYRRYADEWRLLRARVDEGTHTLQVSSREEPPALIYRDASGRLLEELVVEPSPQADGDPDGRGGSWS
jgi:hypothetical protein